MTDRPRPRPVARRLALVGAALLLGAGAVPAQASDLVVTTTADSGPGSLRAAIERANETGDRSRIRFALPGAGVRTIPLRTPLPPLTRPVVVDGYSQPGARRSTSARTWDGRLLVHITPRSGTLPVGLQLVDRSILVRGLVLNGFDAAISVEGPRANVNVVSGNVLGLDPSARSALGNGVGVQVVRGALKTTVGGPTAADRNVLSGNRDAGILVAGLGTDRTRIENNLIGPAGDGTRLPTDRPGQDTGVVLHDDAQRTSVGAAPGSFQRGGNTIAFHEDDGVLVGGSARAASDLTDANPIRFNSIHSNGGADAVGLGINLDGGLQSLPGPSEGEATGRLPHSSDVTANDLLDADTGPNDEQNFPLLTSAQRTGDRVSVLGHLESERSSEYVVDVYATRVVQASSTGRACDASDHGEAERYLTTVAVRTDGLGRAELALVVSGLQAGEELTATATKTRGGNAVAQPVRGTSELSPCLRVP